MPIVFLPTDRDVSQAVMSKIAGTMTVSPRKIFFIPCPFF
jgi:hypothetical protein